MRNLKLLLKLQRINILRLNELRHGHDKKQRRRLGWMLATYVMLGLMGLLYAGFFTWGLYAGGLAELMPSYLTVLCSLMTLMLTLIRANGMLFGLRDYDLLHSLPFKQSELVGSKLIGLYLSALAVAPVVMLPGWIFYTMATGFSLTKMLMMVLVTALSPLLPLALGILISLALTLLTARMRHKNLLFALIMVLSISFLMIFFYTSPMERLEDPAYLANIVLGLESQITRVYPPARLVGDMMRQQSFARLTEFALLMILPFIAAGAFIMRFDAGIQALTAQRSRGRADKKAQGQRSPLMALTMKEGKRLMASPLYLMNSSIMAWMIPIILFILPILKPELLAMLKGMPQIMPVVMQYLPLAAAGGIGLTTTSAISMSMEGKSAWLMGTAPVSTRTILASKGLLNLVITLPCCLITALLLWYHLQLSLIYALACLLLPAAFAVFATVLGLASDVKMARYDWENEQQMVKSSMQVLLGLVVCFVSLLVMAGLLYLAGVYSLPAAYALAGLLLLASALIFRHLARKPIYVIK